MDELGQEDTTHHSLAGPGAQLRQAREQAGLSVEQVAAETRIAARHLSMIEAEDFTGLPGRTYAIGFSRSYAKAVGLDDAMIAREVRATLDLMDPDQYRRPSGAFEPGDPARIPSPRLGWLTALAALLLIVGGYSFYRSYFVPGGELPPLANPEAAKPARPAASRHAKPAAPVAPATGPVTFTALEENVWVKFYDAAGQQLMQKQMAKGESYTVPAVAQGPQLWTGRPDALAITIGGKPVPRLAEREGVMKDVLVTPQALLARPAPEKPRAVASPTD